MRRLLPVFLLLPAFAHAQTKDVLFLGNSYTYVNDLPGTLRQLALSLGDTVNTAQSTPGGYTFQGHTSLAASQQLIDQGGWDFVVLQEQSQIPSFPIGQVQTDCFPYAAQLVDSIKAHSPCAEAVFYMTWGRQNGDAGNCASWPPVCTFDGMNALLRERYLMMAVDNDAWCAPVGAAWKRTRDQQPAINLYSTDGSHPSPEGTYLAACTFYATLYRSSPVGAGYTAGLDPATAATLQDIAASTVLDSLGTWNIGVNDPDAAFTALANSTDVAFTPATGAGTHSWDFGDGGTDSAPAPVHTYAGSGTYAVVHVVTDACGRSDTSTSTVNVVIAGVTDAALSGVAADRFVVMPGRATYTAGQVGELTLHLVNGQLLRRDRVGANGMWSAPLDVPAGTVLLWRFIAPDGKVRTGRAVMP